MAYVVMACEVTDYMVILNLEEAHPTESWLSHCLHIAARVADIRRPELNRPYNYISHNSIGHNYIGHDCAGQNYIGDHYIGHNCICHD